ncbi:MAG: adenosine kinase [Dongiaceae bacterium]
MAAPDLDLLAIGNAIVDTLVHADDEFLVQHGLVKGTMTLVDATRADQLYQASGSGIESSGGSAANTAAGFALMGGRSAFVGRVANDQFGGVFRHDIRANGVEYETESAKGGAPTGRSLVFVTPDAQRTMQTYLGASIELGPEDIDEAQVKRAKILYLEGYLWDPPKAKIAFLKAADLAHAAGRKVALTLSDPFCVERHRDEFRQLVENHVDILFANEAEICALWQTPDFDNAATITRQKTPLAVLTRSEKGSVILAGKQAFSVQAAPVDHVVDTTGAGDQYAAGFLFGLATGRRLDSCARIACLTAAEVISHYGARPVTTLTDQVMARFS